MKSTCWSGWNAAGAGGAFLLNFRLDDRKQRRSRLMLVAADADGESTLAVAV